VGINAIISHAARPRGLQCAGFRSEPEPRYFYSKRRFLWTHPTWICITIA